MLSLVNTNRSYLATIRIARDSTIVSIIISVYSLSYAIGAAIASFWADKRGRKPSIFACLATTALDNLLMFISGLNLTGAGASPWKGGALALHAYRQSCHGPWSRRY
jgi:MFS family permease